MDNKESKVNEEVELKNEEKELDELEKLMKNATEKSESNFEEESFKKKDNKNKKIIIIAIVGALTFIGILIAGALMMKGDEFVDKTEDPKWVGKEKGEEVGDLGFDFTIDVPSWAKTPYNPEYFWTEETEEEVQKTAEEHFSFYQATAWLPSSIGGLFEGEDEGFTNDLDKRYLSNGEENPQFSYVLSDDYRRAYTVYSQRLLNPIFGGWDIWERYSENKNAKSFQSLEDMFSFEWWAKNVEKENGYKNLPILIEKSEGEFEKYNLKGLSSEQSITKANFFGEIVEDENKTVKVELTGKEVMGLPEINTISPVVYTAFNENGTEFKITGELHMTLRPSEARPNLENRIEISDAKLILNRE